MAVETAAVVAAAHAALGARVPTINALNVYPVPDGDTGTNMLLTLEAVLEEASESTYPSPEAAAKAASRAALMGARGNSGVILSQMIRGACEVLGGRTSLTAEAFCAGLEAARERAYASVAEPVEGTMLTVVKDAARAARAALSEEGAGLPGVIGAAAEEAHASVARTPELLAVLREAGVVDAGGLGVAAILDGIHARATGREPGEPAPGGGEKAPNLDAIHAREEAWGYCTEFVVSGFSGDARAFEERIGASGESVLVVADEDLVKVHVHTHDPGATLSYAGGFGRLAAVKIEDMEAQVHSRGTGAAPGPAAEAVLPQSGFGAVVASRGRGNRELFERMGAVVIEGGQGANPSAAEFARAIERAGMSSVVVVTNNKNVLAAAEQVRELVEAEVHVVPTTTVAAGLAAMVGFDAHGEPGEVVEEMREIAASLRSAEVTRSVRDARVGGREVPEGAYLGFLDGELVAVEKSVVDAALVVAREILGDADIVTLVRGEELGEEDAQRIAEGIRRLDGAVEVELRGGGQPLYPLQMVAE